MLPTGELNRVPSIPVTSNFGWSNWLQTRCQRRTTGMEHGVDNNLIFKWLRLWQRGGESRRMPATIAGGTNLFRLLRPCPSTLSTTRCPQQRMTLCVRSPPLTPAPLPVMLSSATANEENPSSELLTVLIRELTGRTHDIPPVRHPHLAGRRGHGYA
jgi:transposase